MTTRRPIQTFLLKD